MADSDSSKLSITPSRDILDELLSPIGAQDFFARIYGETYRHFHGDPGRFSNLLPWADLNSILRRHRLDFPRLRLALNGEIILPETYTERVAGRRSSPELRVEPLTAHLNRGANLIIESIEEVSDSVDELARSLERKLFETVRVNAYASWSQIPGFDPHWDTTDVLVLQTSGVKRWKLYAPERKWPMLRDVEPNMDPPSSAPTAEVSLSPGDVLYLPRGWWHSVNTQEAPSLHLAVGFTPRTGVDLLRCPFTGEQWSHVVAGVGSQGLPVRALWMASMARMLWPRVLTR